MRRLYRLHFVMAAQWNSAGHYYYTLLRHKAAINNNKTYRHLQCYIGLNCHSINTENTKT